MKQKGLNLYLTGILILGVMLAAGGCKTNDDIDTDGPLRSRIQRAVGRTTSTIAGLAGPIVDTVSGLVATVLQEGDLPQSSATYNENTGWWSFSVALATGESADVEARFLDGDGNPQKYFNLSTITVQAKGQASGSEGSCTFDFEITGIGSSSSMYYTVNGSGTSTYEGLTTTYTITDMTYSKLDDAIPESGSVSVSLEGATVTVTFNGSQNVAVTYSYKGFSYTFTINLLTGAVS